MADELAQARQALTATAEEMREKEHNMEIMIADLSHHLNASRQV